MNRIDEFKTKNSKLSSVYFREFRGKNLCSLVLIRGSKISVKKTGSKQAQLGVILDKLGVLLDTFGVIVDNIGVIMDKLGVTNPLKNRISISKTTHFKFSKNKLASSPVNFNAADTPAYSV